jgi:anthranilate phosphoribosyltransferase
MMQVSLERIVRGEHLAATETEAIFREIVAGAVDPHVLAAFLGALRAKGETAAELAGAARGLLAGALPFAREHVVPIGDSCGTGGDGARTLNVSTAVAFVAAAAGLPIAKHGNRAVSSAAGSADVLEALGAPADVEPDVAAQALARTGFCFLHAPRMHPGVRHAMPVRRALGIRTIFNLLGPLVNPARPDVQLLGVADRALVLPMAETLALLGCRAALVVHGAGLDEIALHDVTTAARVRDGSVVMLTITPEDVGVARAPLAALAGGDAAFNAAALRALLERGAPSAFADAVALNAGALLWIAERAPTHARGVELARDVLASGAGARVLTAYEEVCRASRAA